jgi:hypothetical protein
MASRRADADHWICTRRFTADVKGKRRFATAKIGTPERSGRDWACKLSISNVGMREPMLVYGVDQMQAILLAFEGLLTTLRNSGTEWRWIHGEKGDIGVPRFVPGGFGRRFASRLESMIDAETRKFATAAERRHYKSLAKRRSLARHSKSGR